MAASYGEVRIGIDVVYSNEFVACSVNCRQSTKACLSPLIVAGHGGRGRHRGLTIKGPSGENDRSSRMKKLLVGTLAAVYLLFYYRKTYALICN